MQERYSPTDLKISENNFQTPEAYFTHFNTLPIKDQVQEITFLLNLGGTTGINNFNLKKLSLENLELAKKNCLLALTALDLLSIHPDKASIKNFEGMISFLKKKAHLLHDSLRVNFAKAGDKIFAQDRNKASTAAKYWEHAMELGEETSACNIGMHEFNQGLIEIQKGNPKGLDNIKRALYALKLGLFFSNNKKDSDTKELRGLAHDYLGQIEVLPFEDEIPFANTEKALKHMSRAEAYGNTSVSRFKEDYIKSLRPVEGAHCSEIEKADFKEKVIKGLKTETLDNGMIKTRSQLLSKTSATEAQIKKWKEYHDPRLKPEKYGDHSSTLFKLSPSLQILIDAGKISQGNNQYAPLIKALKEGKYSLALRNACVNVLLPFVTLILKYETSLNININDPSATGNLTALDLVNQAKDSEDKTSIVNLLQAHGAKTKQELQVQATQKKSSEGP